MEILDALFFIKKETDHENLNITYLPTCCSRSSGTKEHLFLSSQRDSTFFIEFIFLCGEVN